MTETHNKQIDKNDPEAAREFNEIADQVFAPIYPVIARNTLDKCRNLNTDSGLCLEIGCGPAHLSIAMAGITDMKFIAIDHSPPMLIHAQKNIDKQGLADRITTMPGDVHELPVEDNSVDLVISRGSVLFWQDKPKAFAEIKRVLKPGAAGHIGCGMGSKALKEDIFDKMRQIDNNWDKNHQDRKNQQSPQILEQAAEQAGFSNHTVTRDDAGIWVFVNK